jgi:hypothetical protein
MLELMELYVCGDVSCELAPSISTRSIHLSSVIY